MTADELKAAFARLPGYRDPRPPEYTWARHRWEMRRHAAHDDASRFLQWSTVVATMFTGDTPFVQAEYIALKQAGWLDCLDEPGVGDPLRLAYHLGTSGNMVHQAYHLLAWTRATGRDVAGLNSILEFGGGYGALALVAWRRGFRGEYRFIDFPEMELLQRFYLSNALPGGAIEHFTWRDDGARPDALVGCYSVSEVDAPTRQSVMDRPYGSCLIAYQDTHGGVNNNEWFRVYANRRPEVMWRFVDKEFQPGHHYLIGVVDGIS